jgi:hypothetical protein
MRWPLTTSVIGSTAILLDLILNTFLDPTQGSDCRYVDVVVW